MTKLDYLYVTNWSLWWDLKILFRRFRSCSAGAALTSGRLGVALLGRRGHVEDVCKLVGELRVLERCDDSGRGAGGAPPSACRVGWSRSASAIAATSSGRRSWRFPRSSECRARRRRARRRGSACRRRGTRRSCPGRSSARVPGGRFCIGRKSRSAVRISSIDSACVTVPVQVGPIRATARDLRRSPSERTPARWISIRSPRARVARASRRSTASSRIHVRAREDVDVVDRAAERRRTRAPRRCWRPSCVCR